jgi:hypothetical protein
LPGAIPTRAASAPDVTVGAGQVPETLPEAGTRGPTWDMCAATDEDLTSARFLLRVPGIARFLLSAGRDIRFEAEAGIGPSDIAVFLLGTAFGVLLHQRGQVVLHASAVRVGGNAVLSCGASGVGKSSLAAALAQRGFPVVTDDFCAFDFDGAGAPAVQSDGRQLKLWAHAIAHLSLEAQRGAPVRRQLQKYYVEPELSHSAALPLGAVYFLREARPPHAFGIERPNVADAALLMRQNAYRPLLVRRMDQRADYFRAAASVAATGGVFHLTRPFAFKNMSEVITLLARHWDELALTEAVA